MKRLVLASNNVGKLAEFSGLLMDLGIQVVSQGSLNVPECDEPFETFVENALRKARHAASLTGLAALADDSGICMPALNGAPGVLSARYAGPPEHGDGLGKDVRNNQKLVNDLKNITDRRAYFYCVLVLVRHAHDPQPMIVDGLWWGEVLDEPRGEGGFGYDPHFYVASFDKAAAQLDKTEKNRVSHRGQAVAKLLERLRVEWV